MYPYEETVKPGKYEFLAQFVFTVPALIFLYFFVHDWLLVNIIVGVWLITFAIRLNFKTQVEISGEELLVTGRKREDRIQVREIVEVSKCWFNKQKHRVTAFPYKKSEGSAITRMRLKRGQYPGVFRGIIVRLKNGEQYAVPTHQAGELMTALGFPPDEY